MQATGSGSWVAQASVLGCGGGGVVLRRPSWDGGAAVGRVKGFGVVRCCVQEKRPRVRKTKEERREMVESFVNTYRVSNDGKFPSVNLTHKEVGGSYYIVREIVRDIIQENRVLGPGGLNATALSFEDCPDSVESPVTHVLGQDSVEILDMSDDDQAGMDTMTDMSTQQLLGSSNLLDACILNDAVQNGNMADMSCLETNSEKQDEVPCAQSTEIDPSSSEKQAPSFSHAPDLESEFEMDSLVDAHETTSSLTNGAVITNKSLLQDHDGTTDSTVDEAVRCLQTNGGPEANQTILQEHETQPESVMSNNVQIVDGQSNYTMDTFKSNTNYPETEGTTKSIEVSGVQMLQDQFEQSTTVTDPDEGERAESAISHPELDTKVLPHIEGKNSMVEEDDKELKQSISVVTKEEHDGKSEHGDSTTTAISRHALCLLTLRCMLTVYNFLHASQATSYLENWEGAAEERDQPILANH
uniref:AT3G52170-like helix-turn-helix domain-containing protein n=1 Tax=Oryza punctata TaxID=4537 RepID=A0A0E0MN40_ORYPU